MLTQPLKSFHVGDTIWVDSDVLGYPPTRHVIREIDGNNLLYKDGTPDNWGCKYTVAHHTLLHAHLKALYNLLDQ